MNIHRHRSKERGVSLIELLVAVGIGMVVVLVVTGMLVRGESTKRSTTSVNDVNQTGTYVAYVTDRLVRSAGSGFAQRWREAFGCTLRAANTEGLRYPRQTAYPAPFQALPLTLRVAPAIIHQGASAAGSDVIAVMGGSGGYAESPLRAAVNSVTLNNLRMENTLGLRGDDLVLLAENGLPDCMIEQVQAGFQGSENALLPFSGRYYNVSAGGGSLTGFGQTTGLYVIQLGKGNAANPPQFQLLGVGADNTLMAYDMLEVTNAAPLPVAEGVVEMRAVYGLDTNLDGVVDRWVDPGTAPFDAASLLDGAPASIANIRQIAALRIGFILRTTLPERATDASATSGAALLAERYTAPPQLTLFPDLTGLTRTRTLSTDERRYRHRTVELTVPLRNILSL